MTFFSFTSEEIASLEWEHEEEFEYQEMMYDVVERKEVGNKTYLWCWQDSKESGANRALEKLIAKLIGNSDNKESKDGIIRLLSNLYFQDYTLLSVQRDFYDLHAQNNFYVVFQSKFAASPPIPPPEFY